MITDPINMSPEQLQARYERSQSLHEKLIARRLEKDFKANMTKINCLVIGILASVFVTGFAFGRMSTHVW